MSQRRKSIGYEIVKYNPKYYKNYAYTKNEWTCIEDIGRQFDDGILTKSEYLKMETNYCNTAIQILKHSGCKFVTIEFLGKVSKKIVKRYIKANQTEEDDIDLTFENLRKIEEGKRYNVEKIDFIIRFALRGLIGVYFRNSKNLVALSIESDDFYMGVRTPIDRTIVNKIARSNDLYVDPR